MNTIIKIGLGIALSLPLSIPTSIVSDAYGIEAPSSFRALSTLSPSELVSYSPMSGEQLAAVQGMAGICISCVVQRLGQHGKLSIDVGEAMVSQSNQFIGAGPVTQVNQAMVNQSMINQTFSPSRQQLTVVRVQQSQTLTTQFPNEQQAINLAQEIRTSTQEIINQNLTQLQNGSQPGQSPIGRGERLAREIRVSTQEIINQALMNGIVNARTNQQFTNVTSGGFLR